MKINASLSVLINSSLSFAFVPGKAEILLAFPSSSFAVSHFHAYVISPPVSRNK